MTCNVGHTERMVRIGLGILFLGIGGLTMMPGWGTGLALVIGVVALGTGILGFCPAWRLFGMNTNEHKQTKSS